MKVLPTLWRHDQIHVGEQHYIMFHYHSGSRFTWSTCTNEANPNECWKWFVWCLTSLNVYPALRTYFSLKYQLQINTVWLFTEHSPHKQMLFALPQPHIHINISHISTCLVHIRIAFTYRCGPSFRLLVLQKEFAYDLFKCWVYLVPQWVPNYVQMYHMFCLASLLHALFVFRCLLLK